MDTSDEVMKQLAKLRTALKEFMTPEVLGKFADLLEELGSDESYVERYEFFAEHSENKEDCRYARMAKHYFLEESGDNVINLLEWLYNNFAKKVR